LLEDSLHPEPGTVICAVAGIPDGGACIFAWGEGKATFRLLVLRSGASCLGYVNRCPHFGVPLAEHDEHLIVEAGQWVKCNVHYSRFRWHDGHCDDGECVGDALEPVALAIEDGVVRFA
jgi:nitrite reductase/ring-hydroxylating ferredoxin subunit